MYILSMYIKVKIKSPVRNPIWFVYHHQLRKQALQLAPLYIPQPYLLASIALTDRAAQIVSVSSIKYVMFLL